MRKTGVFGKLDQRRAERSKRRGHQFVLLDAAFPLDFAVAENQHRRRKIFRKSAERRVCVDNRVILLARIFEQLLDVKVRRHLSADRQQSRQLAPVGAASVQPFRVSADHRRQVPAGAPPRNEDRVRVAAVFADVAERPSGRRRRVFDKDRKRNFRRQPITDRDDRQTPLLERLQTLKRRRNVLPAARQTAAVKPNDRRETGLFRVQNINAALRFLIIVGVFQNFRRVIRDALRFRKFNLFLIPGAVFRFLRENATIQRAVATVKVPPTSEKRRARQRRAKNRRFHRFRRKFHRQPLF